MNVNLASWKLPSRSFALVFFWSLGDIKNVFVEKEWKVKWKGKKVGGGRKAGEGNKTALHSTIAILSQLFYIHGYCFDCFTPCSSCILHSRLKLEYVIFQWCLRSWQSRRSCDAKPFEEVHVEKRKLKAKCWVLHWKVLWLMKTVES